MNKRQLIVHIPKGIDFREAIKTLLVAPLGEPEKVHQVIIEIDDDMLVEFRNWMITSLDKTISSTSVKESRK
jgi:hypothetical protein